MKDLLDDGAFNHAVSKPDAGIKPGWWRQKWIPIADNSSGDYICLDLDPSPEGVVGQVILFLHADPVRRRLAPDVEAWLRAFAEEVAAGKYAVEEGWLTKTD